MKNHGAPVGRASPGRTPNAKRQTWSPNLSTRQTDLIARQILARRLHSLPAAQWVRRLLQCHDRAAAQLLQAESAASLLAGFGASDEHPDPSRLTPLRRCVTVFQLNDCR